ncbi:hypothetical protein ASB57_16965 [Bordetella sp. N]|nr:hypothetical protein ASB57_16965 [Bordetella sp. N]
MIARNVNIVTDKAAAFKLIQYGAKQTALELGGTTTVKSGNGVLARTVSENGGRGPILIDMRDKAQAEGDIGADRQDTAAPNVNITVRDDAAWTGRTYYSPTVTGHAVQVDVRDRGTWFVNNDSSVTALGLSGNGRIAFTGPQSTLLDVKGDLKGSGGLLDMRVDTSNGITDRLTIGGKVEGKHGLLVRNSGKEANIKTMPAMITAGQKGEGDFALKNKGQIVEAGVYQYRLNKAEGEAGGDAWRLVYAGEKPVPPAPPPKPGPKPDPKPGPKPGPGPQPQPDPQPAPPPQPAPAPDVDPSLSTQARAVVNTAGLGTSFNLWNAERGMMASRLDEVGRDNAATGFWMRNLGTRQTIDNGLGDAFSQKLAGMRLGADRSFMTEQGRWVLGGLAGYTRADRNLGDGGKGKTDSYQAGLYGAYIADDGTFVSTGLTYNRLNNKYNSIGTDGSSSRAAYNRNGLGLSLDAGRRFGFQDGWFLEPRMGADYLHLGSANFDSNDGMSVRTGSGTVLQARAALKLGRDIEIDKGMVTPYVRVGVAKAWANNGDVVANGITLSPGMGGTRFEVGGGVMLNVAKRHSLYADYRYTRGQGYKQPAAVEVGYRYQF